MLLLSDHHEPPGPSVLSETARRLQGQVWYGAPRHIRKHRGKGRPAPPVPECPLWGQQASGRVRSLLETPGPCMVARFGNNELRTIGNHLTMTDPGALADATQILFGIKGRRWEAYPENVERLSNDAWIRPSSEETPSAAGRVEDGCYWQPCHPPTPTEEDHAAGS